MNIIEPIDYYATVTGSIWNKMIPDHFKSLKCELYTYLQSPHKLG